MANLNIKPATTSDNLVLKDGAGNVKIQVNNNGVDLQDATLIRPKIKDYAETVVDNGSKNVAFNLDLSGGNIHTVTITGGTLNIGITNALASSANSVTLVITNGGLGTISYVAGAHDGGGTAVKWAGGSAPTLSASGVDILVFFTPDGGTTFYGFSGGTDFS